MRPIIAVNNWRVIFNSTPRGKNHLYEMFTFAQNDDTWFSQILTVDDTGVVGQEVLEQEMREMDEDMFRQEYYCSFDAGIMWSYYARILEDLRERQRMTTITEDKSLDTYTSWDLWVSDSTSIRVFQKYWKEIRILDYYENSGESLEHYVQILKEKWYSYTKHYLPHDVQVRELSTWITREEKLRQLWLWDIVVVPKLSVIEWIEATRRVLRNCWFNDKLCKDGLQALNEYHKRRDERRKTFLWPDHDWSSHAADSFRYLSVAVENLLDDQTEDFVVTVDYVDYL